MSCVWIYLQFFEMFAPDNKLTTPSKVVGNNVDNDPGTEAMLDSEYIMGVGRDVSTEFYFTAGGQPGNPQDEPWLAWLAGLANETTLPLVFSAR